MVFESVVDRHHCLTMQCAYVMEEMLTAKNKPKKKTSKVLVGVNETAPEISLKNEKMRDYYFRQTFFFLFVVSKCIFCTAALQTHMFSIISRYYKMCKRYIHFSCTSNLKMCGICIS